MKTNLPHPSKGPVAEILLCVCVCVYVCMEKERESIYDKGAKNT